MAKGNGKQREGGHDSKVARKEVKVCETAWGRVVRWKGKGREGKTRKKRWSKEEMAQGRKGRRWVFPESFHQVQNWKSSDIQHSCDLLMCLGLLKGHLPYGAKM